MFLFFLFKLCHLGIFKHYINNILVGYNVLPFQHLRKKHVLHINSWLSNTKCQAAVKENKMVRRLYSSHKTFLQKIVLHLLYMLYTQQNWRKVELLSHNQKEYKYMTDFHILLDRSIFNTVITVHTKHQKCQCRLDRICM